MEKGRGRNLEAWSKELMGSDLKYSQGGSVGKFQNTQGMLVPPDDICSWPGANQRMQQTSLTQP